MPRPPPTRADDKSQQIRHAAQTLFRTHGYQDTTTDQIAAMAGVSKATLYLRYAQKEDLLTDVFEHFIAASTSAAAPPLVLRDRADLTAALTQLASAVIEQLMQPAYLSMIQVMVTALRSQPGLGQVFVQAVPNQLLDRVLQVLSAAQEAQLLHLTQPEATVRAFIGPLLTYVLIDGLLAATPRPPEAAQIEAQVHLFLNGLRLSERSN